MKNSEPILDKYLKINGFNAQYEQRIGGSDPDFSVWDENGRPFAYWDVKDRKFTSEDQERFEVAYRRAEAGLAGEIISGPDATYDFVRRKMEFKAKQFAKCGSVPGMMVLADWAGCTHPTPEIVGAALEGWPNLIVQMGEGEFEPRLGRSSDGTMWDIPNREVYLGVSAIGFLKFVNVNYFRYGLYAFATQTLQQYENKQYAFELISKAEDKQRSEGINLDYEEPVLDIYLVRDAHYLWPQEVVGQCDTVYSFDKATSSYVLVRDGLAPVEKIVLQSSESQQMIDALTRDPMLRNFS